MYSAGKSLSRTTLGRLLCVCAGSLCAEGTNSIGLNQTCLWAGFERVQPGPPAPCRGLSSRADGSKLVQMGSWLVYPCCCLSPGAFCSCGLPEPAPAMGACRGTDTSEGVGVQGRGGSLVQSCQLKISPHASRQGSLPWQCQRKPFCCHSCQAADWKGAVY